MPESSSSLGDSTVPAQTTTSRSARISLERTVPGDLDADAARALEEQALGARARSAP